MLTSLRMFPIETTQRGVRGSSRQASAARRSRGLGVLARTVMLIRPRSSRLTVDAIGLENGETNPTLGSLATIARALKIPTSKLLEGRRLGRDPLLERRGRVESSVLRTGQADGVVGAGTIGSMA